MTFLGRLDAWMASKRHVCAFEHEAALKRIEALESKIRALPVDSGEATAREVKQLKAKLEQLGLRIGFKAGTGIS